MLVCLHLVLDVANPENIFIKFILIYTNKTTETTDEYERERSGSMLKLQKSELTQWHKHRILSSSSYTNTCSITISQIYYKNKQEIRGRVKAIWHFSVAVINTLVWGNKRRTVPLHRTSQSSLAVCSHRSASCSKALAAICNPNFDCMDSNRQILHLLQGPAPSSKVYMRQNKCH